MRRQEVTRRAFLKAAALLPAALSLGILQACAAPSAPATPAAALVGGAAASPGPAQSPSAAMSPVAAQATLGPSTGGSLRKVRYGDLKLLSDAGTYVAMEEGYFAEQGIEVELTSFDSAANMVPPLGAGQIDAGGGALSAGLFNAFARNIRMLIVADKGHSDPTPPGFPVSIFMVRKPLVDSGRVKSPADLKGLKFGWVATGISTEPDLVALLRQGGLTLNDIERVQMGFPDMTAAFANGGIDAAGPPEPFATNIASQGTGVVLKYDYEVNPGNQVAALLYSADFGKSDLAGRFMLAYLRAVRLYNDAFVKGQPEARAKVISATVAHTPVKDRALYDKMALQALHPHGTLNVQSISAQQGFFLEQGTQQTRVDLANFIDTHFAEDASKQLGPYS